MEPPNSSTMARSNSSWPTEMATKPSLKPILTLLKQSARVPLLNFFGSRRRKETCSAAMSTMIELSYYSSKIARMGWSAS